MVVKTLFILFLLQNKIFDNSQCAAPLTSAARGDRPVGPLSLRHWQKRRLSGRRELCTLSSAKPLVYRKFSSVLRQEG